MQDGTYRPLDATTRTRFIGVYSGRLIAKDDLDTQIGGARQAMNTLSVCGERAGARWKR